MFQWSILQSHSNGPSNPFTLNIIISNTKDLDMDLSSATRSSPRILFARTAAKCQRKCISEVVFPNSVIGTGIWYSPWSTYDKPHGIENGTLHQLIQLEKKSCIISLVPLKHPRVCFENTPCGILKQNQQDYLLPTTWKIWRKGCFI